LRRLGDQIELDEPRVVVIAIIVGRGIVVVIPLFLVVAPRVAIVLALLIVIPALLVLIVLLLLLILLLLLLILLLICVLRENGRTHERKRAYKGCAAKCEISDCHGVVSCVGRPASRAAPLLVFR